MLVPRVVQLRAHHQQLSQSRSSLGLSGLASRRASAPQALARMASPSVDQLVVEFLRKRGLTKTLKAFVSETSYKEPKVSASVELGTVCASYFASKKEVGGKARPDTAFTNGSILKSEVKIAAKQNAESSSDDSDDSSDESEDEEKVVAPAPALKKSVPAVAVSARKANVESSSSESSSDEEEEDVKTVQTSLKVNGVEKKKVEAAVSESSSSDSDDEEEVMPTTSKAEVPVVSNEEESSSDESDDESEEKMAAKTPPPGLSKGKKTSVAAGVLKTTLNPARSSSSDSSSDDEEVGVDQINGVEPVKTADDSSSEEENDVEMKSVTPAVADKKAGKSSTSSDSSDSSDDEMEVDTKPATTVKVVQKATSPKVEAEKADSSSSDSSSDEDSDDEASDEVKNVTEPASTKPAKPSVVKEVASSSDSSSSDSSSDEEEKPKTGAKSVGSKNNASAKIVAVEDDDSSDESVEIKGTIGGSAAAVNGKQVPSDSSDSSDSSDDEEAKVITKPSISKGQKSQVTEEKQVTPEPTVEKSKVKKGKKSPQESAPAAKVAKAVELITPVNKKRKVDDEEADTGHIIKKANVNGIAVATATDNNESKSAQKRKQQSATKDTPTAVRAFQRVKVEEVELLDDRLADNSYWAKAGAEEGWGAKAEEVLGRVRGKGFRHEKTKKKRGSYKGGVIDNASHSIKFENSDDE